MNFILIHTLIFLLLFGTELTEAKSRNRTKSHDLTKNTLKRASQKKKEEIVKILVLLPEDERFLFRKS